VDDADSPLDEETALMRRVAAGDVRAFDALVARVLPRLIGYFRALGAERNLAEDCAQEVLVKVYRVRERYEARARFVTYLFHVARNHWIDVWRHRRAGPATVPSGGPDDEDGPPEPAAPPEPAGERMGRGEIQAAIERAVAALSPEHRQVFVLSQVEGLRYQEIAEVLEVPVGTVKSRMHAAVRHLRDRLRAEGFEP
jgi:RNA polymerase sigma-70 factor (ECF subfamily)